MPTIHDEKGRISGTSPTVLFQLLTIFVWIGAFALLVASAKHAREGHLNPSRFFYARHPFSSVVYRSCGAKEYPQTSLPDATR